MSYLLTYTLRKKMMAVSTAYLCGFISTFPRSSNGRGIDIVDVTYTISWKVGS
jgi:hypothetical protein